MKTFRILYRWQDREYAAVLKNHTAYAALTASQTMLMPGAVAFGVEVL